MTLTWLEHLYFDQYFSSINYISLFWLRSTCTNVWHIIFYNYYTFSLPSPPYSWLFQLIISSFIYLLPPSTLLGVTYSISLIVLPRISTLMTLFSSQVNSSALQVCSRMCVRDTARLTLKQYIFFFYLKIPICIRWSICPLNLITSYSLNKSPNDYYLKTIMSSHMYGKES